MVLKVFEMFSGYGGASFALKKVGIPFECIGYSEIDKSAIKCYEQNHPNVKNYGDCTKIVPEELPDFDLITAGFPCQDVSIMGNRDLSKGRTILFNEIIRIAKVKKPSYMLLENVKGILSAQWFNNQTFHEYVIKELRKCGYDVLWKCLNSKEHGIPQNRERIWYVCKLGIWEFGEFQFPQKEKLKLKVKDLLEENVDKKYYLSDYQIKKLLEKINTNYENKFNPDVSNTLRTRYSSMLSNETYIIDRKKYKDEEKFRQYGDVVPTLISRRRTDEMFVINKGVLRRGEWGDGIKNDGTSFTINSGTGSDLVVHNMQPRSKDRPSFKKAIEEGKPLPSGYGHLSRDDGIAYTLDTGNSQVIEIAPTITTELAHSTGNTFDAEKFVGLTGEFRRMTPREVFRLQGFLNDEINLSGLSDSKCYFLAGNGWDLSVSSKILARMFKEKNQ